MSKLSPRLQEILNALPIRPDSRILEVGCGPGALTRAVARMLTGGKIVAIDRSEKAIAQATKSSFDLIEDGRLEYRRCNAEEFSLKCNEQPFDFAFAIRVGALDGRHPELEALVLERIASSLASDGRIFVDGGAPLRELSSPFAMQISKSSAKKSAHAGQVRPQLERIH